MAPPKKAAPGKRKPEQTPEEVKVSVDTLLTERANRPVQGEKERAIAKARAEQVKEKTKTLDLKEITSGASNLAIDLSSKLQEIVREIQEKGAILEEIREANNLAVQELEETYGKETVQRGLDQLLADHEAKRNELKSAKDALIKEYEALEVEKKRSASEYDAAIAQQRKREQDEYAYKTTQERARALEEFNVQVQAKKRDEAIREESLKRNWDARTQELAKAEQELIELRALKAGYDEAIRKATDAGFKVGFNSANRDKEHEIAILKANYDAERKIAENTEKSLRDNAATLSFQVKSLQDALVEANKKNGELAAAAVSGAAQKQAFADFSAMTAQNNGQVNPKTRT